MMMTSVLECFDTLVVFVLILAFVGTVEMILNVVPYWIQSLGGGYGVRGSGVLKINAGTWLLPNNILRPEKLC